MVCRTLVPGFWSGDDRQPAASLNAGRGGGDAVAGGARKLPIRASPARAAPSTPTTRAVLLPIVASFDLGGQPLLDERDDPAHDGVDDRCSVLGGGPPRIAQHAVVAEQVVADGQGGSAAAQREPGERTEVGA